MVELCSVCDDLPAVVYCSECNKQELGYLCEEDDTTIHGQNKNKSHVRIPILQKNSQSNDISNTITSATPSSIATLAVTPATNHSSTPHTHTHTHGALSGIIAETGSIKKLRNATLHLQNLQLHTNSTSTSASPSKPSSKATTPTTQQQHGVNRYLTLHSNQHGMPKPTHPASTSAPAINRSNTVTFSSIPSNHSTATPPPPASATPIQSSSTASSHPTVPTNSTLSQSSRTLFTTTNTTANATTAQTAVVGSTNHGTLQKPYHSRTSSSGSSTSTHSHSHTNPNTHTHTQPNPHIPPPPHQPPPPPTSSSRHSSYNNTFNSHGEQMCDICDSDPCTYYCESCKRDDSIKSLFYCSDCNDLFHNAKQMKWHVRQLYDVSVSASLAAEKQRSLTNHTQNSSSRRASYASAANHSNNNNTLNATQHHASMEHRSPALPSSSTSTSPSTSYLNNTTKSSSSSSTMKRTSLPPPVLTQINEGDNENLSAFKAATPANSIYRNDTHNHNTTSPYRDGSHHAPTTPTTTTLTRSPQSTSTSSSARSSLNPSYLTSLSAASYTLQAAAKFLRHVPSRDVNHTSSSTHPSHSKLSATQVSTHHIHSQNQPHQQQLTMSAPSSTTSSTHHSTTHLYHTDSHSNSVSLMNGGNTSRDDTMNMNHNMEVKVSHATIDFDAMQQHQQLAVHDTSHNSLPYPSGRPSTSTHHTPQRSLVMRSSHSPQRSRASSPTRMHRYAGAGEGMHMLQPPVTPQRRRNSLVKLPSNEVQSSQTQAHTPTASISTETIISELENKLKQQLTAAENRFESQRQELQTLHHDEQQRLHHEILLLKQQTEELSVKRKKEEEESQHHNNFHPHLQNKIEAKHQQQIEKLQHQLRLNELRFLASSVGLEIDESDLQSSELDLEATEQQLQRAVADIQTKREQQADQQARKQEDLENQFKLQEMKMREMKEQQDVMMKQLVQREHTPPSTTTSTPGQAAAIQHNTHPHSNITPQRHTLQVPQNVTRPLSTHTATTNMPHASPPHLNPHTHTQPHQSQAPHPPAHTYIHPQHITMPALHHTQPVLPHHVPTQPPPPHHFVPSLPPPAHIPMYTSQPPTTTQPHPPTQTPIPYNTQMHPSIIQHSQPHPHMQAYSQPYQHVLLQPHIRTAQLPIDRTSVHRSPASHGIRHLRRHSSTHTTVDTDTGGTDGDDGSEGSSNETEVSTTDQSSSDEDTIIHDSDTETVGGYGGSISRVNSCASLVTSSEMSTHRSVRPAGRRGAHHPHRMKHATATPSNDSYLPISHTSSPTTTHVVVRQPLLATSHAVLQAAAASRHKGSTHHSRPQSALSSRTIHHLMNGVPTRSRPSSAKSQVSSSNGFLHNGSTFASTAPLSRTSRLASSASSHRNKENHTHKVNKKQLHNEFQRVTAMFELSPQLASTLPWSHQTPSVPPAHHNNGRKMPSSSSRSRIRAPQRKASNRGRSRSRSHSRHRGAHHDTTPQTIYIQPLPPAPPSIATHPAYTTTAASTPMLISPSHHIAMTHPPISALPQPPTHPHLYTPSPLLYQQQSLPPQQPQYPSQPSYNMYPIQSSHPSIQPIYSHHPAATTYPPPPNPQPDPHTQHTNGMNSHMVHNIPTLPMQQQQPHTHYPPPPHHHTTIYPPAPPHSHTSHMEAQQQQQYVGTTGNTMNQTITNPNHHNYMNHNHYPHPPTTHLHPPYHDGGETHVPTSTPVITIDSSAVHPQT